MIILLTVISIILDVIDIVIKLFKLKTELKSKEDKDIYYTHDNSPKRNIRTYYQLIPTYQHPIVDVDININEEGID